MKKIVVACLSLLLLQNCKTSQQSKTTSQPPQPNNSATMLTIGTSQIKTSDFKYVYNKNNASTPDAYSEKSLREYLELYTNFRLKILEAEAEGRDTLKDFKAELEGYRKQLAQPYLSEKGVTEQLIKEAYERMKEEVSASHILLNVSPDAEPKDTLAAYTKLMEYRSKALAGVSFDTLARRYSQDPSAKQNFGKLGYFTALQMVYPFEEAAYKTPVGNISLPVRTRFGYHILKVTGRRPSRGEVKVAHIMIRAGEGISKEDSIAAKQKIDELYAKVKSGENWAELCSQFSDDYNSKTNGGELQTFASNQLGVTSFEDAAFGLAKPGDMTTPIKTPYGWHILKLIEKKPLKPFSEMESGIKTKVQRDSRSDMNKTIFIQKRKKEYNYTENAAVLNNVFNTADSSLVKGTFSYKPDNTSLKLPLITIGTKIYSLKDFYDYVVANQKSKQGTSPSAIQRNNFKAFSEKVVMDYEESRLTDKYEDYRMLYKEYRDGILLFSLMDEKVWTKAVNDTLGLREFFEKNKQNYTWKKRNDAIILNANDETTLKKAVNTLKTSNVYAIPDPSFDTLTFAPGKWSVEKEMQSTLNRICNFVKRDKNLIIKITSFETTKDALGSNRLDSVLAYLKSKNANLGQIQKEVKIVRDVPNTKKGKTAKNAKELSPMAGKITFQTFSTSPKALEKIFNAEKPLTLEVSVGKFQQGENDLLDSLTWKVGEFSFKKGNRTVYIWSKALLEPTTKSLDEAKGQAISDYQGYLEKKWIAELRKKYPTKLNEEEFKKLIKQ
jgi:peptidyl-prolyl cis-trans isomerase SurA